METSLVYQDGEFLNFFGLENDEINTRTKISDIKGRDILPNNNVAIARKDSLFILNGSKIKLSYNMSEVVKNSIELPIPDTIRLLVINENKIFVSLVYDISEYYSVWDIKENIFSDPVFLCKNIISRSYIYRINGRKVFFSAKEIYKIIDLSDSNKSSDVKTYGFNFFRQISNGKIIGYDTHREDGDFMILDVNASEMIKVTLKSDSSIKESSRTILFIDTKEIIYFTRNMASQMTNFYKYDRRDNKSTHITIIVGPNEWRNEYLFDYMNRKIIGKSSLDQHIIVIIDMEGNKESLNTIIPRYSLFRLVHNWEKYNKYRKEIIDQISMISNDIRSIISNFL